MKEAPTRKHQLIHKNADKRRRGFDCDRRQAHKIAQGINSENVRHEVEVKSNSLKQRWERFKEQNPQAKLIISFLQPILTFSLFFLDLFTDINATNSAKTRYDYFESLIISSCFEKSSNDYCKLDRNEFKHDGCIEISKALATNTFLQERR